MSDTGEQGVKPQDPAERAGVGAGLVPDDQAEGYAQAAELAEQEREGSAETPAADDAGGA